MHKPIDGPLLMQLINRSTACFLIPTHKLFLHHKVWGTIVFSNVICILDLGSFYMREILRFKLLFF